MRNSDADDTAMVASEIKIFWIVYDTEGIWRGEIEVKSLALWFLVILDIV